MSQKYDKLKTLLKELFQLDQPDLDFGLYRIMHAKGAEVTQFLDRDLLPQVQAAFALYKTADKAEIEKELAKAIEQAQGLGVDPETTQKVNDLRARLKSDAVDVGALESEVYDHLYSYFRRYYSDGDFLSKRVYKPGVYVIPYEGEEVKLHWANADQYYIKTSEYLRDYSLCLRPDDTKNPMRVHFRLVDAAEGEHGNVKAAEGKDRVFILAAAGDTGPALIAEEDSGQGKELVIRLEYRPATLTDWPEDAREGKTKPPAQKDLIALAAHRLLAVAEASLAPWIAVLSKPHMLASGESADYTRLEAHLRRYTARNTFDYFIHKDLGGFLRRELDFYIKNEIMHLDDVENETAPRVEQYLSKIKVIRRIASKIIDFLAQLEDFQKKLWLKKKFVVETQYCITLDRIPEEFFSEIAANDAQRDEWERLFSIDEVKGDLTAPGYSLPLTPAFLKANPTLVVDTRNFPPDFTARLLEAVGDLDQLVDGMLFQSENFHALSLMRARYRGHVKCIYIDPPFNTGDDFAYKDAYQTSSWLALMQERLNRLSEMLSVRGHLFVHLDDNANHLGKLLLRELYDDITEVIFDTNATKDPESGLFSYKSFGKRFVRQHDTIFHCMRDSAAFVKLWKPNRNSSQLNLGQLDLISLPKVTPARRLDDFTFFVEKWAGRELRRHVVDVRDEKIFPIGDLWTDIYSFTQSEMRTSENVSFLTQKPEHLLRRVIQASSGPGDLVVDVFAGSGTTGAVSHKLGRRYVLTEMGEYFNTNYLAPGEDGYELRLGLLGRMKNVLRGDIRFKAADKARRSGLSKAINWEGGGALKYVVLESYEDALNNLETRRTETQRSLLGAVEAQGAGGLKEQYLLRYMLEVETRGSQSLLNVQAFQDPTAYKLKVKRPGSDESCEVSVDLMETFNWLIGLSVQHITAPKAFSAAFERDSEKRLRLKGRLKQGADGPWWFRTVTGTTPDGRITLVIWRKLTGNPEEDNLVLDEWFTKQGYSSKDSEFNLIYVNGGNNLENLKAADDAWKVRLIEEDFHRLMFESEAV
jgi:adenine-specific DNA-methyltransferase